MAVETGENNIEVIETEEIIDGQVHKVTKTITTSIIEETILTEEDTSTTIPQDTVDIQERRSSSSSSSSSSSNHSYESPVDNNTIEIEEINRLICECVTPSGEKSTPVISDNYDGTYTVDINASEPGVHTIDVELNGTKIPGSPYLVRIVQAADKKKVHFYGKGLASGLFDDFEGLFHVDTKGAGPGDLKVRVHGPKDAFKVDMYRDVPGDRVVNVKYEPTVSGMYTINVFWSGEHVDGSPRRVFLANDLDELDNWNSNLDRYEIES